VWINSSANGIGVTSVVAIDVGVVDAVVGGVWWCGGCTARQKIYDSTTWI